jgi:hypothetical protein
LTLRVHRSIIRPFFAAVLFGFACIKEFSMNRKIRLLIPLGLVVASSLASCQSPDHTDQGLLFGGLLGAGTGAVVGHALGNTGAGAAIGAGVGALSGAAVGAGMDQAEARNRAMIEARLGRPVAGAATIPDVVAMTRSAVDEGLIINHIHSHGLAAPLQASDVIYLQQQGVSRNVIAVMQTERVAVAAEAVPVYEAPPAGGVIIEEGPRYYRPYRRYYW